VSQLFHPTLLQRPALHPSAWWRRRPRWIAGFDRAKCVVGEASRSAKTAASIRRRGLSALRAGSARHRHAVVIGADGFGIAKDGEHWIKIRMGRVVIGDDVRSAPTPHRSRAIDDT